MSSAITRRAALARAGALGLTVLGVQGCDDGNPIGKVTEEGARSTIAIDYASFYAPSEDLKRLALVRAEARGAMLRFSDDAAGAAAQKQSLARLLGDSGGFRAVVIAPFDVPSVEQQVAGAAKGVRVVGFITPLAGQAAAITIDGAGAARLLVEHATRWASAHATPSVLVVAPPPTSAVPDPFFAYATSTATALRTALGASDLRVAATVQALGAADAEAAVRAARKATPGIELVLAWNDTTALGAVAAMPVTAYVGAVGAPVITGNLALTALAGPGPLRCLVAPRLKDLASALVDVPFSLIREAPVRSITIPARAFTRGSAAASAARSDYVD